MSLDHSQHWRSYRRQAVDRVANPRSGERSYLFQDHFLRPSIRKYRSALLVCLLVAMVGCGVTYEEPTTSDAIEIGLPVVSGSQLNKYVQASEKPVLVEFGVDFNCSRCAQTKSDVVNLREALQGDVDVIRVDFNANAQTVAQLGGTVCPTYVLFDQGEPIMTRSFPVDFGFSRNVKNDLGGFVLQDGSILGGTRRPQKCCFPNHDCVKSLPA